jgi:N4-gp56 family major capsid protein
MPADISPVTKYSEVVAANPKLRAEVWNQSVTRDARERNAFKDFIGKEGSGLPVVEKRDLNKGGAEKVTFTTVAPIRGQGVLGENELKTNVRRLNFGTFDVTVDLLRHAVSWTQVLQLLRFTGKTIDQLSSEVMAEWWGRKEQDDCQTVLRNTGLSTANNLVRVGNRASRAVMRTADLLTTSTLELSKQHLISNGAAPLGMDKGPMGSDVPKFLFFGPDQFVRSLRSSGSYLQSLRDAGVRGDQNPLFSGKYSMWDNNIVFPHNIVIDTADGRQGSPLAPVAYLGTAIASAAATVITGGGVRYAAGEGDYFAYFPGFGWKTYDSEVIPADSSTHYAMIYNVSGVDKGKYEIVSYTAAGVHATGKQITVTRDSFASPTIPGNTRAKTASRLVQAHVSGAVILPCTEQGVILNWGLHTGAEALYYAKGAIDVERIMHWDDFTTETGKRAHLNAVGVQGIRGFAAYKDSIGRHPNFLLVEGAANIPGIEPEPYV